MKERTKNEIVRLTEEQIAEARANAIEAQRGAPCLTGQFLVFLCDSHETLRAEVERLTLERNEAQMDFQTEMDIVSKEFGERAEEAESDRDLARAEAERLREALRTMQDAADRYVCWARGVGGEHRGSSSFDELAWTAGEAEMVLAGYEVDDG